MDGTPLVLRYEGRSNTRNELHFSDSAGNTYTADYAVIKKPLNKQPDSNLVIMADETGTGEIIASGQRFKLITDSNLKLQLQQSNTPLFTSYEDFVYAHALGRGTIKLAGKEFLFLYPKRQAIRSLLISTETGK